jgi:hypothetical protein
MGTFERRDRIGTQSPQRAQIWQQICIKTRARIVIALKRNGAYADDIQVQQLGYGQVV